MVILPKRNRNIKYSLKYYMVEARTFFANRWKHEMVYPNEAFAIILLKYVFFSVRFQLRRAIGKIEVENDLK